MHVMVGETRSERNIEVLQRNDWGRMFLVCRPTPFMYEKWGFDNGAYIAWRKRLPFPEQAFVKRLHEAYKLDMPPYLAVTPDIVAAGLDSLAFSIRWRMQLPGDWPWYLAVQDGMDTQNVEPQLHLFSGIFLGGTDRFKGTALKWCRLAHKHGLKFHYGRAGTLSKAKHAYMVGADSCDSAFPLWTQERMAQFVAHIGGLKAQGILVTERKP